MNRRVIALLASLACLAAGARADVFADPPITPAAPTAGTSVTAIVISAACGEVDYAVVQTANVIELRYIDPGCPILPPGPYEVAVPIGALPAGTYDMRLVEVFDPQHPQITGEAIFTVLPSPCPAATLCLQGGRFEVTAQWHTGEGSTGGAMPIPLTDETGSFWFFSATNYELMVKVLDACAINDAFWVYAAGLTDVQVTLHVRDTLTGIERDYDNPLGTAFQPVGDTQSFSCSGGPHS